MKVTDLPPEQLKEAPWNPNRMDEAMLQKLRDSLIRYGLVQNLVVRPLEEDCYEVLSGNQRLQVLRELQRSPVPCVVVDLDDAHARLLSQALNRIAGSDDLGLRAELLQKVLEELPQSEVLKLLPETADSLQAFASLGQQDLASYLQNYQQAQTARLKHLTFQFTPPQLEVIEEALAQVLPRASDAGTGNPNPRGNALYLLCLGYLEGEEKKS
ncbi:MAG TPA: ParB N-terminal domain-containing protein [Dehalococcoidia bacterium]|nr:ParB N-terminal domain-containing protein [Dehalococcoidia bacterium]